MCHVIIVVMITVLIYLKSHLYPNRAAALARSSARVRAEGQPVAGAVRVTGGCRRCARAEGRFQRGVGGGARGRDITSFLVR